MTLWGTGQHSSELSHTRQGILWVFFFLIAIPSTLYIYAKILRKVFVCLFKYSTELRRGQYQDINPGPFDSNADIYFPTTPCCVLGRWIDASTFVFSHRHTDRDGWPLRRLLRRSWEMEPQLFIHLNNQFLCVFLISCFTSTLLHSSYFSNKVPSRKP